MSNRTSSLVSADGTPLRITAAADTAHRAATVYGQEAARWSPGLRPADAEIGPERDRIVARSRDMGRNNAWVSGGVQRSVDQAIGSTFRLNYLPDWRALGIAPEEARAFAREVEAAWRMTAMDDRCPMDVQGRLPFAAQMGLAYRQTIEDGEALALVHWKPRRWTACRTAIQIVDPDRLRNPSGKPDGPMLRRGIEMDADGAPVAYHITRSHPYAPWGPFGLVDTTRVPRTTPHGRRRVLHFFEPSRADQSRGRSAVTQGLIKAFMLDRYEGLEMQAAVANAVFAAFMESPHDHQGFADALGEGDRADPLSNYQDARLDYYETAGRPTMDGMNIPMLFPGEKINFVSAMRPNAAFEGFVRTSLRYVATALGQSYEQLAQDWSQTNYSSARAALLESWKYLLARRGHFSAGFATPVFALWLEDAVDSGLVRLPHGAPGFWQAYPAWVRAMWIGPGRGWVDPVKEAQAAGIRMDNDLSTLQQEAADQGLDWEEVLEQHAAVDDHRRALGLSGRKPSTVPVDSDDDPDAADRAERQQQSAARLTEYEGKMAALQAAAQARQPGNME
jgi:lambda family phage portal protein